MHTPYYLCKFFIPSCLHIGYNNLLKMTTVLTEDLSSFEMENINNDNTKSSRLICARHLFSKRNLKMYQ